MKLKRMAAAVIVAIISIGTWVPALAQEAVPEELYTGINCLGAFTWSANPGNIYAFEEWLGRDIQYVLDFIGKENWYSISEPSWLSDEWKKTKFKNKLILSIAPLPDEPADASLEKGAAGEYDNYFVTLGQHLVSRGMTDIIIRPGWEMNGNWYKWSAKNGKEEYFAEYFRHIVTAMRSVKGQNFKFFWNPAYGEQSADAAKCYPGDDYVDFVGIDIYDECWAENTYPIPDDADEEEIMQRWQTALAYHQERKYGLNWLAEFAKEHNKLIIIGEWGVNNRPDKHSGGDNPYFIDMMHDWLKKNNDLIFCHVYFNVFAPDGDHQLSGKTNFPNSALKFLEYWGEEGNTGEAMVKQQQEEKAKADAEEAYQNEEIAKALLYRKLSDAIVLSIGCEKAILNNEIRKIDADETVVPIVHEDRTLIPVRFIGEALDAEVQWDNETKTAHIQNGEDAVSIVIGADNFTLNGEEKPLDSPACIVSERTMIPLRAVSEAFNKRVYWNDAGIIVISNTQDILDDEYEKFYIKLLRRYIESGKLPNPKSLRKIVDAVNAVPQEKPCGKKAPIGRVSASEEPETQNNAQNVLDGNSQTRWVAQGKQWIQAELKTNALVNCVGIGFYKGSQKKYDFSIAVSTDGREWYTVAKGQSDGTTDEMQYYYFPEISGKYVRIYGTGSNENDWNGISMLNVYKKSIE